MKMTVPPTARPVDLQRHLEPAPYTVQEQLSLRRTYRLFVNMGLRHLVVLDPLGSIAGIITRKSFLNMPTRVHPLMMDQSYGAVARFRRAGQAARAAVAALQSRGSTGSRRHSVELGIFSELSYKLGADVEQGFQVAPMRDIGDSME